MRRRSLHRLRAAAVGAGATRLPRRVGDGTGVPPDRRDPRRTALAAAARRARIAFPRALPDWRTDARCTSMAAVFRIHHRRASRDVGPAAERLATNHRRGTDDPAVERLRAPVRAASTGGAGVVRDLIARHGAGRAVQLPARQRRGSATPRTLGRVCSAARRSAARCGGRSSTHSNSSWARRARRDSICSRTR